MTHTETKRLAAEYANREADAAAEYANRATMAAARARDAIAAARKAAKYAKVAAENAKLAAENAERASKAAEMDSAQSGEAHVEGLVRKNHAQAANPTSDVSPWFEHGMTEFERELFYSVSETD